MWDLKDGVVPQQEMYKVRCTYSIARQQVHVSNGPERFPIEQTDEEFEVFIAHVEQNLFPYLPKCFNIMTDYQVENYKNKVRKNYAVASCIAVIDADGKFLLTRRSS